MYIAVFLLQRLPDRVEVLLGEGSFSEVSNHYYNKLCNQKAAFIQASWMSRDLQIHSYHLQRHFMFASCIACVSSSSAA